jgi:hypothetical protein
MQNEKKQVIDKHEKRGGGNLLNFEVDVGDIKMQKLRKIRSFEAASLYVPGNLSAEGQIVLKCLFSCFERQDSVQEGLIGDLIWGFQQVSPPIPPACTLKGLEDLRVRGYIKYQAPDNTYVDLKSDAVEKSWVRYQPKLLEMVYSKEK